MSENEYAKIISKNLKNVMFNAGKTQADVSRDLKINKATVSSWMNGTRIPRMDKIDLLCHYFNISRQELMEPNLGTDLTDAEQLMSIYKVLNNVGRERLLEYANLLSGNPDYTKDIPRKEKVM